MDCTDKRMKVLQEAGKKAWIQRQAQCNEAVVVYSTKK